VFHVLEIFIAGDGALSQCPFINGPRQSRFVPWFHASFNEVAHDTGNIASEKETVTTGIGRRRQLGLPVPAQRRSRNQPKK
jgi:hypothetical protein